MWFIRFYYPWEVWHEFIVLIILHWGFISSVSPLMRVCGLEMEFNKGLIMFASLNPLLLRIALYLCHFVLAKWQLHCQSKHLVRAGGNDWELQWTLMWQWRCNFSEKFPRKKPLAEIVGLLPTAVSSWMRNYPSPPFINNWLIFVMKISSRQKTRHLKGGLEVLLVVRGHAVQHTREEVPLTSKQISHKMGHAAAAQRRMARSNVKCELGP